MKTGKTKNQLLIRSLLRDGAPLVVDSFAGGGGASTGIGLALGREVDIAINHDPEAIEMHTVNHPQTAHFCESVWDVDPLEATGGNPVGLAWFSPDCKHFSKAKGGKPRDKNIRGLAWVVLRWVNAVEPEVIALENVEEFQGWCPIASDGNPSKWRPGWFFRCFVGALRRRGYIVDTRELRACDYGSPTIRKRFFLIARRDGRPIVWPEPTHGDPKSAEVKEGRLLPWRSASECIDWSIPALSIFERKKPLAEKTCKRIAKGIMRYVIESAKPFVVGGIVPHITKFRSGSTGHPVDEPLHTVTAGGDCKRPAGAAHAMGLVTAHLTECANGSSQRNFSVEDPLRTQCAETKGGHFALVSAHLQRQFGQSVGSSMEDPAGTVMANGGGKSALVTAFLAKHYGGVVGVPMTAPSGTIISRDSHSLVTASIAKFRGSNVGHGADEPLHTISAGGTHFAEVRAFLVKYYGSDKDVTSIEDPMHTVTSRDRFALVVIDGQEYAISDIGLRMLTPRELYRAQGFPESYVIGDGTRGESLRLTKSAQVRMCGNSVCPDVSEAITRANVPYLATGYVEPCLAVAQ